MHPRRFQAGKDPSTARGPDPTRRGGAARWKRLAVGKTVRRLGQHVVLSLPRCSYVVTRSRPYRARQSREVEAVSGWRLGMQRERGGLGEPRPTHVKWWRLGTFVYFVY